MQTINEYAKKDDRFHVIPIKHSHNVSQVRNTGIAEAKGKYIAILDADDVTLPYRLEKQVNFLENHPETVLLGGYYGIIDAKGTLIRKKKKPHLHDPGLRWRLTFGNCLIHSTIMFKRRLSLNAVGTALKANSQKIWTYTVESYLWAVLPSFLRFYHFGDHTLKAFQKQRLKSIFNDIVFKQQNDP